jgi:hypothetical protein
VLYCPFQVRRHASDISRCLPLCHRLFGRLSRCDPNGINGGRRYGFSHPRDASVVVGGGGRGCGGGDGRVVGFCAALVGLLALVSGHLLWNRYFNCLCTCVCHFFFITLAVAVVVVVAVKLLLLLFLLLLFFCYCIVMGIICLFLYKNKTHSLFPSTAFFFSSSFQALV